jgi:hypothetical protein
MQRGPGGRCVPQTARHRGTWRELGAPPEPQRSPARSLSAEHLTRAPRAARPASWLPLATARVSPRPRASRAPGSSWAACQSTGTGAAAVWVWRMEREGPGWEARPRRKPFCSVPVPDASRLSDALRPYCATPVAGGFSPSDFVKSYLRALT